jgi:hypothetical protein
VTSDNSSTAERSFLVKAGRLPPGVEHIISTEGSLLKNQLGCQLKIEYIVKNSRKIAVVNMK